VHTTALRHLRRLHTGKVRDIYEIDASTMLIVTTDRLSAFDVVLPDPIPDKGRVLTEISDFWFGKTAHIIPNQLAGRGLEGLPLDADERALLDGRSAVVRRLKALPLEAVVRGYLIGSGWKDYQRTGAVCGIPLPPGLPLAARLDQPLFTPATKAAVGEHDENVAFDEACRIIGPDLAARVRDAALALYGFAAAHALRRGIIIADTKFEFGVWRDRIILCDEVLTPDSSRFWPADGYTAGGPQPSFDKQPLRDWLHQERLAGRWNGEAPPPPLPEHVVEATSLRYLDAYRRITGRALDLAQFS
jgi:phosphoribosylaminoimidazole-succinocarboxamide synthase